MNLTEIRAVVDAGYREGWWTGLVLGAVLAFFVAGLVYAVGYL